MVGAVNGCGSLGTVLQGPVTAALAARYGWGSVFWRSWARVIRGRLPAIGRPNAGILDHGPPPAYARGQAAVGGAEPWPRVQPGVLRGLRAAAGL